MRRLLCLLPVLLSGCTLFGPSSEDESRLATFQRNAGLYYESRDFDRALYQVRRGLEIQPDDYKLHLIRGMTMWRRSLKDKSLLNAAKEQFDKVLSLRGGYDQDVRAYYGAGVVAQGISLVHQAKRDELQADIDRKNYEAGELAARKAAVAAEEAKRRGELERARGYFERMVEKGDMLRYAHYHLMLVQAQLGRNEPAIVSGSEHLRRSKEQQDYLRREIDQASSVGYESETRDQLNQLLNQEIEVRAFLANLHFERAEYQKAIGHLDEILLRRPTRFDDYFNRAKCRARLGDVTQAKADFQQFLDYSNLPREHKHVDEALRYMRSQ